MNNNLSKYAPIVLRVGLGIVFILIAADQFMNPVSWSSYFPAFMGSNAVYFNATFDIILGLWLVIGLFSRVSGTLAALHLLGVIVVLGYNSVTVRDFGLFCAALSVALHGADAWCIGKQI